MWRFTGHHLFNFSIIIFYCDVGAYVFTKEVDLITDGSGPSKTIVGKSGVGCHAWENDAEIFSISDDGRYISDTCNIEMYGGERGLTHLSSMEGYRRVDNVKVKHKCDNKLACKRLNDLEAATDYYTNKLKSLPMNDPNAQGLRDGLEIIGRLREMKNGEQGIHFDSSWIDHTKHGNEEPVKRAHYLANYGRLNGFTDCTGWKRKKIMLKITILEKKMRKGKL